MQKIGGGQPLSYTNPNAYEPSFREGNDLLHATGSISRPAIPTKGGFIPSVMGNLVQNGAMLVPLATVAAHRMLENPMKTRKQRGGKNWETLRDEAKRDLSLIGKASAVNINRLASIRKRGESNAQFLDDFAARKGSVAANANALLAAPVAAPPKPAKRPAPAPGPDKVSTWQENRKRAKNYLTRIGKPSGPNIASYASMMRKGQNTKAFLNEFQARAPKVKEPKAPKAVPPPPAARATSVREKKPVVPIYVPSPAILPPAIKTRKVGEKGVAWKENRERAKEFLSQYGQPRGTNITTFASLKRKGDAAAESDFLASFQSRPPPVKKQTKPRRMSQSERKEAEAYEEESKEEESKEEESKEEELPAPLAPAPAQKPRKTKAKTESTEQWKLNRERAKDLLQRIGSATAAEISKLASMMRRNENTSGFLESVRSRVNATRKRLTLLKQKKELSTVPENVNENEAEPYSLSNNNGKGYEPLLNKSNNEVVNLTSNYQPPAYVPLPERNTTRKAPNLQNFRKHLQLLKQKLQREKV
jgi:hypothetical protein